MGDTQNMLQGTLGDLAARNQQRQMDLRNPNMKGVIPIGNKQVNSSFNLNPLLMSQSNNVI